jgi:hypothetical protein
MHYINSQNVIFSKWKWKFDWANDSCIFIPVNFTTVSHISMYICFSWFCLFYFDYVYILCIIIDVQHKIIKLLN